MANRNLTSAKAAKNDEFYTQWRDIEKEVNAYLDFDPDVFRGKVVLCPCDDPEWSNFTKFFALHFHDFGLKKLVSTSFAADSNKFNADYAPTLFETESPKYDAQKTRKRGKIFVLERTADNEHKPVIDIDELQWDYLSKDGDFRSDEVTKLRDEIDIVVTNPPFSLFREFLAWIMDAEKQFLVIGNMNALTYKEVFPLIKENKIWLGTTSGAKEYIKPDKTFQKMGNTCWFTNLNHGRRHQPLILRNTADNLRFCRHADLKGKKAYDKYDNYDAIDVPYTDAIPSDHIGVMGVPISFLEKYCPEQFEIVGGTANGQVPDNFKIGNYKTYNNPYMKTGEKIYQRILIRHKKGVDQ